MRLFFFSAILTWKYEVNLVHIPPWQRLANERENYIFGSSRVAWKLLNVVNINKESDDFVIVIALLPHIIFIRLISEWAKCYLKVLRLLSTLFSWKLNFPLSWSWSYSTEIFDNGSPCTDLSHEQNFRVRCNAAYLKFIPLTLRLKTPLFIHPVFPSTPYFAPYPWAHESFVSYTVIIFPLCSLCCL